MSDLISREEAIAIATNRESYARGEAARACRGIAISLSMLPAAPAVKVKPLEWRQYGDAGSVAFSDVTGRQYAIFPSVGREGEFAMRGSEDRGFTYHLSIEAAQTAAQEHHAARILAALEGCV